MSIDKEGFQHLEWSADELKIVRHAGKNRTKTKVKSDKAKKLLKEIKKSRAPKDVKNFHSTKLKNYSISEDDKIEFRNSRTKLRLPKQAYVLINIGEDLFYRLSVKTYNKLTKLSYVTIEFHLTVQDDYMKKPQNVFKQTKVIFSINDLLHYMVNSRYLVDVVYGIQDKASIFSDYDFQFRILEVENSGKMEYFKSINEFLQKYNLRQI